MDIKAKIDEIVEKIKSDPNILKEFEADPAAVIEKLAGVDLPNDRINAVVDGVKAKISVDGAKEKLSGLLGGFIK
ncbi:MAG: hypothetical protein ACI4Q6_05835 [Huintestinicola sp.]